MFGIAFLHTQIASQAYAGHPAQAAGQIGFYLTFGFVSLLTATYLATFIVAEPGQGRSRGDFHSLLFVGGFLLTAATGIKFFAYLSLLLSSYVVLSALRRLLIFLAGRILADDSADETNAPDE